MSQHTPMVSTDSLHAYQAARRHAAVVPRSGLARIVVSGRDRATYLHGLLTNDVAGLQAGQGCYAAYLTPQGRMITDLWIYELGDVLLLTLPRGTKDTVLAKLDQFIFTEDVQLGDVTDTFGDLALVGPEAQRLLGGVLSCGVEPLSLPEHGNLRTDFEGQPVIVLQASDPGEPGYDLLADAAVLGALRTRLIDDGAAELDADTAETLRIEAGVPRFHADMDEETIPLEAGIEARAISLTKGCYVGQEVIIRVLHRGHGRVARKLVGLAFEGATLPAVGEGLQAEGKDIGKVTSRTWSPALERGIGLGYLHRDFVAPGTIVTANGVTAHVTTVPFLAHDGTTVNAEHAENAEKPR